MLDLVGPLEVFKFAPEYEVAVASPEGTTELQLNHGFKISDAVPFTKLPAQIDTLVVAGGPGRMTNCMTTNISAASLGWHLDRVGWRLSVPERSCSQPLDCLTAKGRSPIGLLRQAFAAISFRRS